jgi:hypothetical protein
MSNQKQRIITLEFLGPRGLDLPAVWFAPHSKSPSIDDALNASLETRIRDWESPANDRNLGVRLVDGGIELVIAAPDEQWIRCFFAACDWLKVDARAAYGPEGKPLTSILLKIDDPETIARWADLWPKGFQDRHDRWISTEFVTSSLPTAKSKPIWRHSSPLPGSRFAGSNIVWRPMGKPAAADVELGLEDLERRALAKTTMEHVVEANAYATILFWVRDYLDGLAEWDESLVRVIGGWLARIAREGADINVPGKSIAAVCWSPVATMADVGDVVAFLRKHGSAPRDLEVALLYADSELERNPVAPIPGWPALGGLLSFNARRGVRRAFRAGQDIDAIERMAERYAFDCSTNAYLDRDAILAGLPYSHRSEDLTRRHASNVIWLGKKPFNPFKIYESSQLRLDVARGDFCPGSEPGGVLRYSPAHGGVVNGDLKRPDEFRILNTYSGILLKPVGTIDQAVMDTALAGLHGMLGYLTQENEAQILWLKKWIAWIVQHPGIKQQVCPVIIGGQGIGKSLFGEKLMAALFGSLAGTAEAASLKEDRFFIAQFVNKLVTFIDEARLENTSSINQLKKLIRNDRIAAQVKFQDPRDHQVLSRIIIAANTMDIGLTAADAADRGLFFILAWTPDSKKMTEIEFQEWAWSLKGFYADFMHTLERHDIRQHLMRYFMDLECTREEIEDLSLSARTDESVVRATMSKTREVARSIVADARILDNFDITAWFTTANLRAAIQRVDGKRSRVEATQVMMEFERCGILETIRGDLRRFKFGYGAILRRMGAAHALDVVPNHDYRPGDFDLNPISTAEGAPKWRGKDKAKPAVHEDYDPDHMPEF